MKKIHLLFILSFVSLCGFATPPPASDVFQLTTVKIDPNTLAVHWHIKEGFFLYKKRIHIIESSKSNYRLGTIHFPTGIKQTNPHKKSYFVYRDQLTLSVPILGTEPGEALLNVKYQGCSDDGFCYPPQTSHIKIAIDNGLALSDVVIETDESTQKPEVAPTNEADKLERLFATGSSALIIFSFFGFGLLLSFTPCVLPMVPVLSGIIVGHGKQLSTHKAFFLSLSYVLSMSLTYAAVGAVIALMGSNLQIVMQSPWAIGLFSAIFVLLALSMFNFYELRLPVAWQAKLASVTRSQSSGHYLSAAVMGSLSTLILSPCVTAPLIGALGYIAQSGNVKLGVLSLFFLGLGMGTPLLLIGTSAGKLLPRAGHWMNAVKSFFGVMLIAVAIYLMQRILPTMLSMGLWASLLIFSGIYMDALNKASSNQEKFRQGLGLMSLGYGVLIMIGGSQGNGNPLQPLTQQSAPLYVQSEHHAVTLKTLADVQKALTNALGKPVMIDFYADWCESCKEIEQTTLKDAKIKQALSDFVVIKADVSTNNKDSKALLNQFNVVAPPTFIFFNAKGAELNKLRLVGETSTATFYDHLNEASR